MHSAENEYTVGLYIGYRKWQKTKFLHFSCASFEYYWVFKKHWQGDGVEGSRPLQEVQ